MKLTFISVSLAVIFGSTAAIAAMTETIDSAKGKVVAASDSIAVICMSEIGFRIRRRRRRGDIRQIVQVIVRKNIGKFAGCRDGGMDTGDRIGDIQAEPIAWR